METNELHSTAKQVLIAEDDTPIRLLLQKFLKIWGYRTLVASNGTEALHLAEQHHGDVDLLLTDVTMPGMDGQELADKLTKKQPFVKVILMSGFSHMQIGLRSGWKFIQKPFKPAVVKEAIEKAL